MERGSQIFRFTIPGSLFVLTGVGSYVLAKTFWGGHLSFSAVTTSTAPIAALIPIGLIGFLLYQLYYWRYSPFFFGKYVTRDQVGEALSGLPPDVLAGLRTLFNARLD